MKHFWTEDELIECFTFSHDELKLFANRSAPTRIGFAVLLKFFQCEGRFPGAPHEIPKSVIKYIAQQIDVPTEALSNYKWEGRTIESHRNQLRKLFGFREWSRRHLNELIAWLQSNILPEQFKHEQLKEAALSHLRDLKIEPPRTIPMERIVNSAMSSWEGNFFKNLSGASRARTSGQNHFPL